MAAWQNTMLKLFPNVKRAATMANLQACLPSLERYAIAPLRKHQDAKDLVHDSIVQALRQLHRQSGGEDSEGIRVTIFTRPMQADRAATKTIAVGENNTRGFAWICDGQGCSVLATGSQDNLRTLANNVRRSVDPT
jgi:hypothetical protein